MTRLGRLRRFTNLFALAAALGPAAGCRPCLEFDCSGGFAWVGVVPDEAEEIEVRVGTPQSVFVHTCTLGGDASLPEDRCVLEVERLEPGSDEESLASAGSGDEDDDGYDGSVSIWVHTFDPRSEDSQWTNASGPETVDVEVRIDGALVLNETYEPDYLEQSKGPGCGVCVHQDSVTVDLRE